MIPLNLNQAIKPKSLMETLIEAQDHGFTMIFTPIVGITQSLPEFAEELLEIHVDYQQYARYGNIIVRLTDAWQDAPEIYELS